MDKQPNIEFETWEDVARYKQRDRERLAAMPPDEAQAEVDSILHPKLWRVKDPDQLNWPGDLADALNGEDLP